jgi:hypothetical protein
VEVVGMSEADEQRTVNVRVSDPALLDAIKDAEEGATLSGVVREALRSHLLDDDESGDAGGLSQMQMKGLEALREHTGGSGSVEVGVAKTVVAAKCNIKKEFVKDSVFRPLRREGLIGVSSRTHAAYVQVRPAGSRDAPKEKATADD